MSSLLKENPLAKPPPDGTRSSVSIHTHPLHPMMVTFPIAYLLGALGSDVGFWWTGDAFWARASLWLLGAGLATGVAAALAGVGDFVLVKEIRRLTSSWSHFLMGVVVLAMAAPNWWMRVGDAAGSVVPWGLALSAATAAAVAGAGWMGAKLVFDHNVGHVD